MTKSEPRHVGSGVYQAGYVFAKSIKSGVKGVVYQPYLGIRQRNVLKTARGVLVGISGLALSPIVGALGATAKLSKGIESTTHLLDALPVGRLRHARALFHDPQILPLGPTTVTWNRVVVSIQGWKWIFPQSRNGSKDENEEFSTTKRLVIVLEYGNQKLISEPQDLHRSGRIAAEDVRNFEISINPELDGYASRVSVCHTEISLRF